MKQNIQESALETGLSNHSKTKIKKSPAPARNEIRRSQSPAPARIPSPRSRANPFAWFYNLKY